jgi:hypothetical protein
MFLTRSFQIGWGTRSFLKPTNRRISIAGGADRIVNKRRDKIEIKNGYQEFWLQRQIPVYIPLYGLQQRSFSLHSPHHIQPKENLA